MDLIQVKTDIQRPLEVLGITEMEERVYRALLAHSMATAEDIASLLSLPFSDVQSLLRNIELKGLANHLPERPPRYLAASPKLAVEALVSQRQAILERALLTIPELTKQFSAASTYAREQIVEVISGPSAVSQVLLQLRQTVQHEVFAFQRAPFLYPGLINKHEMRSGVRVRTISDAEFLTLPGSLDTLRLDIEQGEEARMFDTLPSKMLIVDRSVGLIPLSVNDQGGTVLLVRESGLLNALCSLFESIWERATPLVILPSGKVQAGKVATRRYGDTQRLAPLLAAGLSDKEIAYELRLSAATLNRRIGEMMKSTGTRSRFQLGWRLGMEATSQSPGPSDD